MNSSKTKPDSQTVFEIVSGGLFTGALFYGILLIPMLVVFPTYRPIVFYAIAVLGLIGTMILVRLRLHPTPLYQRLHFICISASCALVGYEGLVNVFPNNSFAISVVSAGAMIIAHTITILDHKAATWIRRGLLTPTTKLGLVITFSIIPLIFVMSFVITFDNVEAGKSLMVSLIFWLVALGLPFSDVGSGTRLEKKD